MVWELRNPLFAGLVRCGCLLGVGELVDQSLSRESFREKRGRSVRKKR